MSDIQQARARFVAALDDRIDASAADVFDEGLRMAEAGSSRDDIKAYLDGVTSARAGVSTFADAGQCAADCKDQCNGYPDGGPWYACYAGCFAGCMSA